MFARKLMCMFPLLITLALVLPGIAQNTVSGDVTGVVTDPSGAVLPNTQVILKSNDTGEAQTATTNAAGVYRFSLLKPGPYTLSAKAQGFQQTQQTVNVAVGQASTINLQLAVGAASQTVEVSAEAGVVQTQGGNISTTFTPEQVAQVPNPGND